MSISEKVEYRSPITVKSLVVTISFIVITETLSTFTKAYSTRGGLFVSFMLPFFYIPLFNLLLGKISPRLKLNINEMVLLLSAWFFIYGISMTGTVSPLNYFFEGEMHRGIVVLNDARYKTAFGAMVPSFMFPKSAEAVSAYMNGLKPGQALPWGEYVLPICYWTAYTTLVFVLIWWLTIALWGKRWVEVENLPFTTTVPFLYSIEASYDIDKETNKSRWLSFRLTETKVFWISAVAGIALGGGSLFNVYGLGGGYGTVPGFGFPIEIRNLLPGARTGGTYYIDQGILWLLLPINSLATIVLVWLGVEVIYLMVAAQAGWIVYGPGGTYPTQPHWNITQPFPYGYIWGGAWVGFGIVTLWTLRGRFVEMFNSLRGKNITEFGFSLKQSTIFGLITIVGLILFFIGTGVPLITSLIIVGFSIITFTALGKLQAIFWLHDWDASFAQWVWQAPGVALGYWPMNSTASTMTYAQFATRSIEIPGFYDGNLRCDGWSPGSAVGIYNIAHMAKTNMKHLLIGVIIISVATTVTYYISSTWFFNHAGGVLHTSVGSVSPGKYGRLFTGDTVTPVKDSATLSWWYLIGMIIVFVPFMLRMKFSWFWIDPAAVAYPLPYMGWHWGPALVALIVKLIMIRVIGATRFTTYARSIASGLVIGYVAPIIILWITDFPAMIANFQAYYVP